MVVRSISEAGIPVTEHLLHCRNVVIDPGCLVIGIFLHNLVQGCRSGWFSMSLLGTLRLSHANPWSLGPNGPIFIICHGGIEMLKSCTSMDDPISYLKLPVQPHLTVKGNFIISNN